MPRIAFLTMDSLEGFVCYDNLVRDILLQRHIQVDDVSWRSKGVDWNRYDLVIIRSPWDYQQAADDFLTVLASIDASSAVLLNSMEIVRWNVKKTYLQRLEEAGVTIVPTRWLTNPSVTDLTGLFESLGVDEVVVKPVVGANADNAFWLRSESPSDQFEAAAKVFRNQVALAQPFVSSVTNYGEVSLIFFGGQYSHSVLKTPKAGDFRVQEEHGGLIQPITADRELIEFARNSLESVPGCTLYARADVVYLADARPAIMELELIEPSLYVSFAPEAPGRFADAITDYLRSL